MPCKCYGLAYTSIKIIKIALKQFLQTCLAVFFFYLTLLGDQDKRELTPRNKPTQVSRRELLADRKTKVERSQFAKRAILMHIVTIYCVFLWLDLIRVNE